jgi:magnesium chelatase subunit D
VTAPYPFTAVVGLDDLRLALVVNAVSPAVGGVLVRGEKGTAKSTVVRALAALLPDVDVVAGCRFSCDPAAPATDCPDLDRHGAATTRPARLAELPVGASEDRLVGSLDLERALTTGVSAYEPGLLAAAHRGVLYVDEVNLLHDHLVDLLLDAAALGTSYVEREGVSVRHPARFLLVGTMNPEEGELRPQLLDRFGLTVEVAATRDPAERADVVRRRLAYEADPEGFAAGYAASDAELAASIAAARARLPQVVLGDRALQEVTTVCAAFDVDGLRADLVTAKAAVALAAWAGRTEVSTDDVRTAARLALPHRRRRTPFEAPGLDEQQLDDALDSVPPAPDSGPPEGDDEPPGGGAPPEGAAEDGADDGDRGGRRRTRTPATPRRSDPARRPTLRPLRPVPRSPPSPCRCPGSTGSPARPVGARGPRAAAVGSPARACPPVACRRCTSPPRSGPPRRSRSAGAGPARAWWSAAATCARPSARGARATWCSSSSTRAAPWLPAPA